MKKLTALLIVLLISLCCLPALAGCKFSENFELNYDENDNPYYVYSASGWTSRMKGEFTVPSEHDGVPVTEIAAQGLSYTGLTKITVPKSVTKIGNAAFSYNYSLKEVVFEEGTELEEIPRGAFGYDRALESIVIPDSVKTIGTMAFLYCEALKSAVFPDGLEEIGERAFNYTALEEVFIPDSVKTIGCGVFHTCEKLKTATVGAGVTVIPSGAFGYCPALEAVYLPANLTKIEGALYGEDGTFLFGHAFHYNTALADIYFAGTSAQWAEVIIENDPVTVQTAKYDNSAIVNATMHYGNNQ